MITTLFDSMADLFDFDKYFCLSDPRQKQLATDASDKTHCQCASSKCNPLWYSAAKLYDMPHNYFVEKNDKGEIANEVVEFTYTPWHANDISCTYIDNADGKKLRISIGDKSKADTALADSASYRGITRSSTVIELQVSDKIDPKNIKLTANDGILRIVMPVPHAEEVNSKINIPIECK